MSFQPFQNASRENRALVRVLVLTGLALAVAWIAYAAVGHRLIESVYRGERWDFLARAFEDRDTRPVESYYDRVDTLLVLLSGYFAITVATIAALVTRPRNAVAMKLWVVVVGVAILVPMTVVKPVFYGDGPEYLTMTESLANHFSPDLRDADLENLVRQERAFGFSFSRRDPRQYYFESRDGLLYSYHFWLYPAVNLPLKLLLRALRANEARAFQITNALLFTLALWFIASCSTLSVTQRWLFALLALFCPAFWFISWPHPEVFSYSLVILSMVCMSRGQWPSAVFWSALASTQNQPLLFFVAFVWLRGIIAAPRDLRSASVASAAGLVAFLPNLFFYIHFRVGSLLAREAASFSNIDVKRATEVFFDPNIGMLPYLPFVVLLFVGLLVHDAAVERRLTARIQLSVLLFVMALACAPTFLWNHGTTGPSRYVVWMLPIVFYAVIEAVGRWRALAPVVGVAIVWQAITVLAVGGYTPPLTQMSHTPLARFILDHAPALYNPTPEIFAVRTSHRMPDITYTSAQGFRAKLPPTPIVYRSGDRCRKALIVGDQRRELAASCGTDGRIKGRASTDRAIYVNF